MSERRGLWRHNDGTREGKYLVLRRDGTVPEWPNFVLGAADPAAAEALLAYAAKAQELGYDPDYVTDIAALAVEFNNYCLDEGRGDPDAPRHRKDDRRVIRWMRERQIDPPFEPAESLQEETNA